MVTVSIVGPTTAFIRATGSKIEYRAMGSTPGMMVVFSLDTGRITTCTDKEYILGLTAESMKVITLMTRKKGLVSINILTVDVTKVSGKMVSSMDKVPS